MKKNWIFKFWSFTLSFLLMFSISAVSFADENTQDEYIRFGVNGATVTYDVTTVGNPAVTRGDFFAKFPSGSTQNLAAVPYTVKVQDAYNLFINGTQVTMIDEPGPWKTYSANGNFTQGYVLFAVKDSNGTLIRDYDMTAGIDGQTVHLKVYFYMELPLMWANNQYTYTPIVPAPSSPAAATAVRTKAQALKNLGVMSVAVPVQTTAMQALQEAQNGPNGTPRFVADGMANNYISAMGTNNNQKLAARDISNNSGWMYKIGQTDISNMSESQIHQNSKDTSFANVGAGQYKLTTSDKVMYWGFVLNYMNPNDWGAMPW